MTIKYSEIVCNCIDDLGLSLAILSVKLQLDCSMFFCVPIYNFLDALVLKVLPLDKGALRIRLFNVRLEK